MRGSARWSTVAPSRRSRSAVRSSTRDWAVRRASSSPVKRAFVIEFAGQLVGAQGGLGGAHFQLLDHALQVAALFATLVVGLVDRVGRLALGQFLGQRFAFGYQGIFLCKIFHPNNKTW